MILHSKLQRRHTWPFELFEFLVESNNGNQDDDEAGGTGNRENGNGLKGEEETEDSTNNNRTNGINNEALEDVNLYYDQHEKKPRHHQQLEHPLKYEGSGNNDRSHLLENLSPNHHAKNRPDVCTCKSSNNKIGLLEATTVLCASVLSHSQNGVAVPNANARIVSSPTTPSTNTCGSTSAVDYINSTHPTGICVKPFLRPEDDEDSANPKNNKTEYFNDLSSSAGTATSVGVVPISPALKEKKVAGLFYNNKS
jgi:hypothetical protein